MHCGTYNELYQEVAAKAVDLCGVVVLDGTMNSGKSTVARHLARDLKGFRVSADSYIVAGKGGPFVDRLVLDYLMDDVARLLRCFPLVFFEGICAKDALSKIGVKPVMSIYVKTIASNGLWHFQYDLDEFMNETEKCIDEPFLSDYEYHVRARPHEHASITYVKIAD